MKNTRRKTPDDLAGKYTKIEPPRGIEKFTQEIKKGSKQNGGYEISQNLWN
jgi:hypothetical protein